LNRKKKKSKVRRRLRKMLRPLRQGLLIAGFRLLLGVCRLLPHGAVLRLGRALGALGYHCARKERNQALANLEAAFDRELTDSQRRDFTRQVFQSLAMGVLETLNATTWSKEDYLDAVQFEGDEHWKAALAPGKGSLFLTGHFGNWELMPPAFYHHSGIVAGAVMRDFRNAALTRRVRAIRGFHGNPIFSTEAPAVGLVRMIKKGGVISMLGDQDTQHVRAIHVDFFGRPALTPLGPAYLARRTGASILPLFIRRRRDDPRRHLFRFHPPIFPDPSLPEDQDVRRMLQAFTDALEQEVRSEPGQWVWIHERWRHQPKRRP